MAFNPNTSLLAGMSTEALQAALTSAQQAYLSLSMGTNAASVTLSSAETSRSVTYRQADLGQILALIQLLQAQLGIARHPRRAIAVVG